MARCGRYETAARCGKSGWRYGVENPDGDTAGKIRTAVLLETGKGKEKVMKKSLVVLAFGTLGLGIAEFGMMSILSAAAEGAGEFRLQRRGI